MAGNFRKHDPLTGAASSTVKLDFNGSGIPWSGYSVDTAPVFGASFGYVIAPPNLVAIDPVANKIAWTANGNYTSTPAEGETDTVGGWLSIAARRVIVAGNTAVTAYVLSK
jgi:hypothetical protein